ncbi:MAG TPA: class I SAM-dependent methyltransferase [Sphingomicrobium sp.]|nr:class I SAM-dependent methyltransferase [Sphingomicrobium sp.]
MEAHVYERMAELDSGHWWFAARRKILESVLRRVVRPPANARLLEIGCGTGHNLEMLSRFGNVEATELNEGARKLASKRLGREVRSAALPDLSMFEPASFDVIALLDVLEHIPDDRGALDAARALLKPGGKLLLAVPANPWMWSAHDIAHHHHRRYRKRELRRLAESSGYAVDLLSPFNTLLFPAIAAARVAGKITGRESSDDSMPPAVVNAALKRVFELEAPLIGRLPMPVGVSLVGVFRRLAGREQ